MQFTSSIFSLIQKSYEYFMSLFFFFQLRIFLCFFAAFTILCKGNFQSLCSIHTTCSTLALFPTDLSIVLVKRAFYISAMTFLYLFISFLRWPTFNSVPVCHSFHFVIQTILMAIASGVQSGLLSLQAIRGNCCQFFEIVDYFLALVQIFHGGKVGSIMFLPFLVVVLILPLLLWRNIVILDPWPITFIFVPIHIGLNTGDDGQKNGMLNKLPAVPMSGGILFIHTFSLTSFGSGVFLLLIIGRKFAIYAVKRDEYLSFFSSVSELQDSSSGQQIYK